MGARSAKLWVIAAAQEAQVGSALEVSWEHPVLIGRKLERGGLMLDDPKLSRLHARIAWDGRAGTFRFADADSSNGSYVDGVRIQGVTTLRNGAIIRVGDCVLVFRRDDPARTLRERLDQAAPSDASVLLRGESGTGKEVAARALHERSGRRGPFLALNCASLSRELLASELFGHQRGAFSGAVAERPGLFRAANGGTVLLDEIGDLPMELQPALLRTLQERSVRPVGSEREVPVDVRVIAATHQDLEHLIQQGAFRLDLRARLAHVEICLPPLRERAHELPGLIAQLATAQGITPRIPASSMELLALGNWPENMRELQRLIGRLRIFGTPPHVMSRDFIKLEAPQLLERRAVEQPGQVKSGKTGMSRDEVEALLARNGHRVADAAREAGVSRMQVYRWLKQLGLATPARGSKD